MDELAVGDILNKIETFVLTGIRTRCDCFSLKILIQKWAWNDKFKILMV